MMLSEEIWGRTGFPQPKVRFGGPEQLRQGLGPGGNFSVSQSIWRLGHNGDTPTPFVARYAETPGAK